MNCVLWECLSLFDNFFSDVLVSGIINMEMSMKVKDEVDVCELCQ